MAAVKCGDRCWAVDRLLTADGVFLCILKLLGAIACTVSDSARGCFADPKTDALSS